MRAFRWIVAVTFTLFLVLSSGLVGAKKKQPTTDEEDASRLTAETFAGLEMRGIGPALMSGRVADIVVDPDRQSTWYVAVGSGGVWKTTNAGTTWEPIFDGQTSYSIGSIALDPRNLSTV